VIDGDGVAAVGNPVTFGSLGGMQFTIDDRIRYGRVRIGTAVGSELVDLPVPMRAEYYDAAAGFVANVADTCTTNVSLALSGYTESLSIGDTCVRDNGAPGQSGIGCAAPAPLGMRYSEPPVVGGNFDLRLAAPLAGNQGSVTIQGTVPTWLQFDWNSAAAGDENPTGQATFGIFGGERRLIYTREIY
jgi:MSHA biogenesis protein MshQ